MNYLKIKYKYPTLLFIITILMISSCFKQHEKVTNKPTLKDYTIGENWSWKYKGVSGEGEVRSNGIDTKEIVDFKGELGLTSGNDTILISDILKPITSKTPRFKWPLVVGKKWTYERTWISQDSTTGKQSQDAEVLSYKEETVEAGTFMAYTIEYKGTISNSRGYSARTDEVWLYAPKIKNFIKLTQIQDDFKYNEELIKYSNPNKK